MRAPALLIALLAWAASPGLAWSAAPLTASGCSVSMVGYLTDLTADYQRLTGVTTFARGGGSVVGLEDLMTGKSDFAASCRGKRRADPADVEFVQVAWDALVFIVHPANPVGGISLDQAAAIFEGRLEDWGRLGGPARPIQVFLQRPTTGLSGVEDSIRALVLKGRPPASGPNVLELASTAIVEQLVEKTPEGFAASGYSSARKRAVRMLALSGVEPTRRTIADHTYPLRRPLYLVAKKPVKPEVRAFLDFALGAKGQELLSSYGVVSLREVK